MPSLFTVTTSAASPLDASREAPPHAASVSNFLTLQSFTNFAAMTGAISAAWHALQRFDAAFAALSVPYAFAALWAVISLAMSWDTLRREKQLGTLLGAIFVAAINALVLAGAVVGTDIAVGGTAAAPR